LATVSVSGVPVTSAIQVLPKSQPACPSERIAKGFLTEGKDLSGCGNGLLFGRKSISREMGANKLMIFDIADGKGLCSPGKVSIFPIESAAAVLYIQFAIKKPFREVRATSPAL
jgi:hypothetical protein